VTGGLVTVGGGAGGRAEMTEADVVGGWITVIDGLETWK
jgi:hypothetical protein